MAARKLIWAFVYWRAATCFSPCRTFALSATAGDGKKREKEQHGGEENPQAVFHDGISTRSPLGGTRPPRVTPLLRIPFSVLPNRTPVRGPASRREEIALHA